MRQSKQTKDFNMVLEVRKKLGGAVTILVVQGKLQSKCQQRRMHTGGVSGFKETGHSRQQG